MDSQTSIDVKSLTVIGCTLSVINQTAAVDSKMKKLLSLQPVVTKTESEWQTWHPTAQVTTADILDPRIDYVSCAKVQYTYCCADAPQSANQAPQFDSVNASWTSDY